MQQTMTDTPFFAFQASDAHRSFEGGDADGRELVPGAWYVGERCQTDEVDEQETHFYNVATTPLSEEQARIEAQRLNDGSMHGATVWRCEASFTLDGEPIGLVDFLNANEETLTTPEREWIAAMRPGGEITFGGGSAPTSIFRMEGPAEDQDGRPMQVGFWYIRALGQDHPGGHFAGRLGAILDGPFTSETDARTVLVADNVGGDHGLARWGGPEPEMAARWAEQLYTDDEPDRAVAETGYLDGVRGHSGFIPCDGSRMAYYKGYAAGRAARECGRTSLDTKINQLPGGLFRVFLLDEFGREANIVVWPDGRDCSDDLDEARMRAQEVGVLVSQPTDPSDLPLALERFAPLMESVDALEIANAVTACGLVWMDNRDVAADLEARRPSFRAELERRLVREQDLTATAAEKAARAHPDYIDYQEECTRAARARDEAEIMWNALVLRGFALLNRARPQVQDLPVH